MEEGATPSLLPRNLTRLLLALPSTGGAVSLITSRSPFSVVTALRGEFGTILTCIVTPWEWDLRYIAPGRPLASVILNADYRLLKTGGELVERLHHELLQEENGQQNYDR
jgi:hypothetical protein